jgi:transcription elongation factor GreA
MIITKQGYDKLANELKKLINVDLVDASHQLEETRPIGVSDEFPMEYLQALDNQNRIEKKIIDINEILANSVIYNSSMIKKSPNGNYLVGFGASVSFVNCDDDVEKTFTIVSSYESDINNGFISIEAPLVKEMINLKVGDFFEFNEIEYVISNIQYPL